MKATAYLWKIIWLVNGFIIILHDKSYKIVLADFIEELTTLATLSFDLYIFESAQWLVKNTKL